MNSKTKDEIRKKLEEMAEDVPRIQEVETWDQQFYVRVDGGRDVAECVIATLEESYVGEEYEIELLHDMDTDDVDVRVVSPTLKDTEREVKERLNQHLNEFDR